MASRTYQGHASGMGDLESVGLTKRDADTVRKAVHRIELNALQLHGDRAIGAPATGRNRTRLNFHLEKGSAYTKKALVVVKSNICVEDVRDKLGWRLPEGEEEDVD